MTDLYREAILDAFHNPVNRGLLSSADYHAEATNASCGDTLTISLKIDQLTQRVQAVGWEGAGCAISQAGMSALSEFLIGKMLTEVRSLTQADLLDLLGFEAISPGREKCLLLGLRAVQRAIKQY